MKTLNNNFDYKGLLNEIETYEKEFGRGGIAELMRPV